MRLILLAVYWLLGLLILLAVVVYGLYRSKRLEVGSKITLGDVANFVSVLLAIFALAFTLAAQHEPEPALTATLQQGMLDAAAKTVLKDGASVDFEMLREGGRLMLLMENTGDAPLRRPIYILRGKPSGVRIRCAEEFPQFRPSTDPDVCQFNSPYDIFPVSNRKIPNAFGFAFAVPDGLTSAVVEILIQSENLPMHTYSVNLKVSP